MHPSADAPKASGDSYFELSCGGNKRWLGVFVKQRRGTMGKLRRKEKSAHDHRYVDNGEKRKPL